MDTNELQNQLDALTQRLDELENRPQVPGPQGKPGNIAAAIANAEQVAAKIVNESEARHLARIAELEKLVKDQTANFEKTVRDLEARFEKNNQDNVRYFREGIENQVVAQILGLLQEYHVLDSENQPTAQYVMHQIRQELGAK